MSQHSFESEPITAQEARCLSQNYNKSDSFERHMQEIYDRIRFNSSMGRRIIFHELFLSHQNVERIVQELLAKGYNVEKELFHSHGELFISW
jgi:hypothetical protein